MTSERAQAYGRVMKHLADLGQAKLQPVEQDTIREAADTLLFCEDPDRPEALDSLHEVELLAERLIESGRFTDERATRLLDDLAACGPLAPVG